jgi:heme/copper-type cytochrome/quinol oxidase subunit 2
LKGLVVAVAALLLLGIAPPTAEEPSERLLRIEASQYRFDPGVVQVKRGDTVTIELVATDVVHGLYLDGYNLQMEADPGQTARLTFVADRAGTFRFRCSVSCGAMHPFMIGKLGVGQNTLLWIGIGLALLAVVAGVGLAGGKRG